MGGVDRLLADMRRPFYRWGAKGAAGCTVCHARSVTRYARWLDAVFVGKGAWFFGLQYRCGVSLGAVIIGRARIGWLAIMGCLACGKIYN